MMFFAALQKIPDEFPSTLSAVCRQGLPQTENFLYLFKIKEKYRLSGYGCDCRQHDSIFRIRGMSSHKNDGF
ncbi:hypothetical protein [Paracandidimonas soli]|uniref:hypothetical protein n=1 Tax=Paracandidimonas soli TaxID=1917182 RepID=UPI00334047C1